MLQKSYGNPGASSASSKIKHALMKSTALFVVDQET